MWVRHSGRGAQNPHPNPLQKGEGVAPAPQRLLHASGGRSTGFAGAVAQRPLGGAESYVKRTNVGASAAAPGRPKQGQPPRGAAYYTK